MKHPDDETASAVRLAARAGFEGLTVGRARGFAQANLAILPADDAAEFLEFCRLNSKPCPVLGCGEPGDIHLPSLGDGIDVTRDVPRYQVHEGGTIREVSEIGRFWRDDLVAIALGCWFGAERALADAGIRLRHVELGIQGPLFRTGRDTKSVGRFHPKLVVSMRPFAKGDVARVTQITSTLPDSHGAPLHVGDPTVLGIADPASPEWGEPLLPETGEEAMFWACGLTGTEALKSANLPFFITHAPGAMLVTDLPAS